MGISTVAEGVETIAELKMIALLGRDWTVDAYEAELKRGEN